jgi:hypothetical protein
MGRNTKQKCSSSSDSSSSSSESSVFVKSKQKQHKHHKKSESDRKSDCNSDKKHHKHRKSESDSECKSESEKNHRKCKENSDEKEKCKQSSESHSDCDKKKYCFDEVYNYYKFRLLNDESLMVAGSDAYIYSYNNIEQTIPKSYPVNYSNNGYNYNIEHVSFNAPFAVRESGIYIVFYIAHVEQSAQFSLFVNGQLEANSTNGNNAGAGQLVLRSMLRLNKDDTVMVRNYLSSSSSLLAAQNAGGLQPGNNMTFLLAKISPLPNYEYDKIAHTWDHSCLSRKKLHLYKKLLEKMLCDKELMLKGFNVHGTFFSQNSQTILTENNVVWDKYLNVAGLNWYASNPDQIQILEDGVYKVFFVANTNTAGQFTICVNDVPYDPSTQGSDKGAGQITTRTILELRKGDYITVKNHTSTNGQLVTSANAGGFQQSMSVLCTVFKIAPLCKPMMPQCKLNDYHKKCYEKFRNFLLSNKCLQITGSPAYLSTVSTHAQYIPVNQAFSFEVNALQKDICHTQATTEIIIEKDGIYDIFADVITQQSCQITLFVNGTPDLNTVSGRDSGASRTIMRQFIKLCKGDCVTVRNYDSHAGELITGSNNGGELVGHPALFMLFKLANVEEDCYLKPCPPCPPKKK